MPITIEEVVERIADWRDKSVAVHPLSGGLTNTNYRVEVDGTPYVVRIPGASTELLAVHRKNEYHNTQAAAQAGVTPKIAHYLHDENVMALEFIHGETMSIARLQGPGMPTRMAESLRKLHAGPRFLLDFNMFRLTEYYLKVADEHAVRIPDRFRDRMPAVYRVEEALARHPLPTVPCHNDLLAENYIDNGKMLWLIDFEYSGNNDPTFELGNTCQEQQFDEPRLVEMCAAYFGSPQADKLARMKLNMIMSDVGWTLWAAIQAKISAIDYDFWGWAVERWARAEAKIDSAEFERWLAEV
ncbi:MAG: phosphotransferase family protein [Chloroflexi bacterium]|nr:phosphotransferase family protein [Chloroflexota bacterium]